MHDWASGEVKSEYGLGDYKAKFGTVGILGMNVEQKMPIIIASARNTSIFIELTCTMFSWIP